MQIYKYIYISTYILVQLYACIHIELIDVWDQSSIPICAIEFNWFCVVNNEWCHICIQINKWLFDDRYNWNGVLQFDEATFSTQTMNLIQVSTRVYIREDPCTSNHIGVISDVHRSNTRRNSCIICVLQSFQTKNKDYSNIYTSGVNSETFNATWISSCTL